LSDELNDGGSLTQSAYDVIEAESTLITHPRGSRLRNDENNNEDGDDLSAQSLSERPTAILSQDQRPSNSLSAQTTLTESLFNMLSKTSPPDSWKAPSSPPLSSTAAAREADQKERRQRARLPLGPNGALMRAIDHPLCAECTNILLYVMEEQLKELRRERDSFIAFEEEVKRARKEAADGDQVEKVTQADIDKLIEEAETVKKDLAIAEKEAVDVQSQLNQLDEEERSLHAEEQQFWRAMNALNLEVTDLSAQRSSLQQSLARDKSLLNRLEMTNVYNDAFSIGYDGGYATINGLRLGRIPNDVRGIEWSEINAAWGQTAFLLYTLARRCDFTFSDYRVHPVGSFSTIEKMGERKEVYELYGSGDWQLGRLLTDRRFDHAMVAFLDCVRQLCTEVQRRDASVKFPHTISRDKIGGASIRLQFGSDEIWTRALRNVLMTLKVLLAWSINLGDDFEDVATTSPAPAPKEGDAHVES
jgi:beclin 1